jgi:hypothetical protein
MLVQGFIAEFVFSLFIAEYWFLFESSKAIIIYYVVLEVLPAVVMKGHIFRDIRPCSPLKVNRRSGGTFRLQLPGLCLTLFSCLA